jgi:hypothetical protein
MLEGLTPENAVKLSALVRRFHRDITRQRVLRAEIRRIVREELYLQERHYDSARYRPDLADK